MGIGDEAGGALDFQIKAAKELGWKYIEMRGVEVPGYAKANFHEIPDAVFDIAAAKIQEAGLGVYCFGSTIMNWAKTVETPFDVTLGEVRRAQTEAKGLTTGWDFSGTVIRGAENGKGPQAGARVVGLVERGAS